MAQLTHEWTYNQATDTYTCKHCSSSTYDPTALHRILGDCKRIKGELTIDQIQEVLEARVPNALEAADFAFWQAITTAFPEATTGDLDPLTTFQLHEKMKAAINSWIWYNIALSDEVKEIRV